MKLAALDNLGLKLFSVVMAFSLWYIVAGGRGHGNGRARIPRV